MQFYNTNSNTLRVSGDGIPNLSAKDQVSPVENIEAELWRNAN